MNGVRPPAAVAALLLAGVTGTSAATEVADTKRTRAGDSGVRGLITSDGMCAGPIRPEGDGCDPRPLERVVRVLRRCDRKEVARFESRKQDGRFRIGLRPGRYLLDPLEGTGGFYKGRIRVRVKRGEFVRLRIVYDDGGL